MTGVNNSSYHVNLLSPLQVEKEDGAREPEKLKGVMEGHGDCTSFHPSVPFWLVSWLYHVYDYIHCPKSSPRDVCSPQLMHITEGARKSYILFCAQVWALNKDNKTNLFLSLCFVSHSIILSPGHVIIISHHNYPNNNFDYLNPKTQSIIKKVSII